MELDDPVVVVYVPTVAVARSLLLKRAHYVDALFIYRDTEKRERSRLPLARPGGGTDGRTEQLRCYDLRWPRPSDRRPFVRLSG